MAPNSSNPTDAAQGTVLVVDDDPQIGAIVRVVLRRAGYDCLIAQDGDTAWKLLSPAVTLVLLDVMMPGQNGPEILWRMRRDPAVAHIPPASTATSSIIGTSFIPCAANPWRS